MQTNVKIKRENVTTEHDRLAFSNRVSGSGAAWTFFFFFLLLLRLKRKVNEQIFFVFFCL